MIAAGGEREESTKMLERVLDFSERQVKDVTVPRPEVIGTGDGHAARRHPSHRGNDALHAVPRLPQHAGQRRRAFFTART